MLSRSTGSVCDGRSWTIGIPLIVLIIRGVRNEGWRIVMVGSRILIEARVKWEMIVDHILGNRISVEEKGVDRWRLEGVIWVERVGGHAKG